MFNRHSHRIPLSWYDPLYLAGSVEKEAGTLRRKLEEGKPDPCHYVITLAMNKTDLLDIYPSYQLNQTSLRKQLPPIVGLAVSKKEALKIVQEMTEDCLRDQGDVDLRRYLEKRHFTEAGTS